MLTEAFTLRSAESRDFEELTRLWAILDALHLQASPNIYRSPEGLARSTQFVEGMLASPDRALFVADVDVKLVGLCALHLVVQGEIPVRAKRITVEIASIVVEPEARRSGVARALVAASEDWAKAQGAVGLELVVHDFNRSAIAFYDDYGFSVSSHRMVREWSIDSD
jgi:ribosomal protein S18 acetylase RimI-like enzyme